MFKPLFILFFSILVALSACKQSHSKNREKFHKFSSISIDELTKLIAQNNILVSNAVGIAGQRTAQWDFFEQLKLRSTATQLVKLTSDTNAVVRCYAFQALVARKADGLYPIVLQHLSDIAKVKTMYGCIGSTQTVGDFFLETIDGNDGNGLLTAVHKATIDSLLLFDKKNNCTHDMLC